MEQMISAIVPCSYLSWSTLTFTWHNNGQRTMAKQPGF